MGYTDDKKSGLAPDVYVLVACKAEHIIAYVQKRRNIIELKEISKDIYDVDAWLDEGLGKEGTPEREKNREKAWEEYNAQILLDTRKNARLTQADLPSV